MKLNHSNDWQHNILKFITESYLIRHRGSSEKVDHNFVLTFTWWSSSTCNKQSINWWVTSGASKYHSKHNAYVWREYTNGYIPSRDAVLVRPGREFRLKGAFSILATAPISSLLSAGCQIHAEQTDIQHVEDIIDTSTHHHSKWGCVGQSQIHIHMILQCAWNVPIITIVYAHYCNYIQVGAKNINFPIWHPH